MVYNALKLFMEINSDYFAEAMEQYKQHKIEEQQHGVARYEAWQKLRELARQNAPNGKLPGSFVDREPTPPPPPVPEEDLLDLNMDFNAISIEGEGDLDESGIERVPMADPGMDRPFPEIGVDHSSASPNGPQSPHVRRKSTLPVDPSVLRDLQAHRSLDDGSNGQAEA